MLGEYAEHAQSLAHTGTNQASLKPSNLACCGLEARYGSRAFRPNLEGPAPYEHEGRGHATNFQGPAPNLTSTKGGDMRQTSKEYFLLLQFSESANARNNIGCFCACIEPFRRASRGVYPTRLALRKGFAAPKNAVEVNKGFTPCDIGTLVSWKRNHCSIGCPSAQSILCCF